MILFIAFFLMALTFVDAKIEKTAKSGDCTVGRMTIEPTHIVPGQSLLCSFTHSHSSLIHLLCIVRFARALCCAHPFVCSLISHSRAHGKDIFLDER